MWGCDNEIETWGLWINEAHLSHLTSLIMTALKHLNTHFCFTRLVTAKYKQAKPIVYMKVYRRYQSGDYSIWMKKILTMMSLVKFDWRSTIGWCLNIFCQKINKKIRIALDELISLFIMRYVKKDAPRRTSVLLWGVSATGSTHFVVYTQFV